MKKDNRGRKSIQQHKLDGTYRHHRHDDKLEGTILTELPEIPDRLKGRSRSEFKKLGNILISKGVLTDLDLNLFEMYCTQFQIIDDAYQELKDKGVMLEGSRGMIKSPAFGVLKEAIQMQLSISIKFGFTPVDRARVQVPGREDIDPLEEVLRVAK